MFHRIKNFYVLLMLVLWYTLWEISNHCFDYNACPFWRKKLKIFFRLLSHWHVLPPQKSSTILLGFRCHLSYKQKINSVEWISFQHSFCLDSKYAFVPLMWLPEAYLDVWTRRETQLKGPELRKNWKIIVNPDVAGYAKNQNHWKALPESSEKRKKNNLRKNKIILNNKIETKWEPVFYT